MCYHFVFVLQKQRGTGEGGHRGEREYRERRSEDERRHEFAIKFLTNYEL